MLTERAYSNQTSALMKKLAIEFTGGIRRELTIAGNALLFLSAAASGEKGPELPAEPILLGNSEVIEVTDETQELSARHLQVNIRTGAAASVATLEDGLYIGQHLTVYCKALGTGGDALTLTSATGIVDASQSALTSLDFNAADEFALLVWNGEAWQVINATAAETA